MKSSHSLPSINPSVKRTTIAIAASFTAEPITECLDFWMQELNNPARIEFAPYNQIFQQLLDPTSLLSQNSSGINVVLLRLEDWLRFNSQATVNQDYLALIEQNVQDLIAGVKAAVERSTVPYIICLCPASPSTPDPAHWETFFQRMETLIETELNAIPGLHLIHYNQVLQTYPVAEYYDSQQDRLGHIPYTPSFFTALGTALARRIYAIKHPPYKVIVLDCDNTLWRGIVGEDGVSGIQIPSAWKILQTFMLEQQQAGMLLCLCSKNQEADVIAVLEQRSDMLIRREHLVSWRINWLPKSENLKSLAAELNLGLDSFIFIDDNPVECAEVQANCPEVLTLQLPVEPEISRFLQHIWAFDHLQTTAEDAQRTALYQQNVQRQRFQQQAPSIETFLAGLALKVTIAEPSFAQLSRVAQLTQRTNQFNFTTLRRSESEVQQLSQSGIQCRIVEVSDRFGDYGLVGVLLFSTDTDALQIDTFLLSCRVLGRGVEHEMIRHLAELAAEQHLQWINAPYSPTPKNLPALNFLENVAADYRQTTDQGYCFQIPVEQAKSIRYTPGNRQNSSSSPVQSVAQSFDDSKPVKPQVAKSQIVGRIAKELSTAEQILASIQAQQFNSRSQSDRPIRSPRTTTEQQLAGLWTQILSIAPIGITDNFFELGGTSLQAVTLFAQIERTFGKGFPLTTLLEAPTIEQLACLLDPAAAPAQRTADQGSSLVALNDCKSSPATLFLMHTGRGEILLYRNLAQRLKSVLPVYALKPYSDGDYPILHTRIQDMAAFYVQQIRTIQPEGPYLLGGFCAGGVIALEMALQLQQQGHKVGLVALIDSGDTQTPTWHEATVADLLNQVGEIWRQNSHRSRWQQSIYTVKLAGPEGIRFAKSTVKNWLRAAKLQVKIALYQDSLNRRQPKPSFLKGMSIQSVYNFASKNYRPTIQFQGDVLLLRTVEQPQSDDGYTSQYFRDPLLGWERRITGTVRAYNMLGDANGMLHEPYVAAVAEKLQASINTALGQHQLSV